jgi:sulfite reductase (NADPH) flavoprotein alpha-component
MQRGNFCAFLALCIFFVVKETFLAAIKERICLNKGSDKQTYHLIVDLTGSGIEYQVGDCLGIYPENDPELVKSLMEALQAKGDEVIEDRQGILYPLRHFLLYHANLKRLPQKEAWTPLSFCKKLPPQLPRFYSIASSREVVGNEAHLTVGLIDGMCSQFLCNRAPLGVPILPIFHQPSRNFSLPLESFEQPIIMIGPGTGIAPFRGFMQERINKKSLSKNWLFFGERHRKTDFYYEQFWQQLICEGKMEVDCAFSRDQPEKVYVQHKMLEKSSQVWKWLQEGAYLFVCGNASKMAKDVDKTLHLIAEQEGGLSGAEAKNFIKELKQAKRYQRDVY